mmetsp:Transcript_10690/g.17482  ORF Transcript_10690/g.17482 Transcript_10690/m.17482 type:complete len:801 (-) Transcript_10690:45-2447(-)
MDIFPPGVSYNDTGGDNDCGGGDSSSFKYSWVIAVVLCVIAAIVSNFGTNLQKLAWNKRRDEREQEAATYVSTVTSANQAGGAVEYSGSNTVSTVMTEVPASLENETKFRRYWILGFLSILIGSIFDFAALGFGAQSVVAPLGSLTLVANIFFAQLMHGEKLSSRDVGATVVIILGCILSVAFASHKNEICDIDALLALYGKPRFAFYASSIILILLGSLFAVRYIERIVKVYGTKSRRYRQLSVYHRFLYSFLSGVVGAQSILFAKSLDELLVSSFQGDSKLFLAHIGSYMIAIGMFCSIALQIYWLNCGLARWDALYVVPVFQAVWIVFSVIGGGVFYGEFNGFSFVQASAFLAGVVLTVLGVYFLSQRDIADPERLILLAGDEETCDTNISTMSSRRRRRRKLRRSFASSATRDDDEFDQERLEMGLSAAATMPAGLDLNECLNSPLLGSGTPHQMYTPTGTPRSSARRQRVEEYDVVFTDARVGLSVEPYRVPSRRSIGVRKRPSIKLWRVQATRLGPDHPVKVGHVIVAVNGESVVGPQIRLPVVLELITNGGRPMTIRFRTEPTTDQPTFETNSESSFRRRSASGVSAAQQQEDDDGQDLLGSTFASATVDSGAVRRDSSGYSEDEMVLSDDSHDTGPGNSGLQGVALNPLLELIHSWNTAGPSAYDELAQEQDRMPYVNTLRTTASTIGYANLDRNNTSGHTRSRSQSDGSSAIQGFLQTVHQKVGDDLDTLIDAVAGIEEPIRRTASAGEPTSAPSGETKSDEEAKQNINQQEEETDNAKDDEDYDDLEVRV